MKKPIIGLTSTQDVMVGKRISRINQPYIDAVVAAGGVPLIIPVLENGNLSDEYTDVIDGLILTGGEDMSSHYFGEEPVKQIKMIDHNRDRTELGLFHSAYKKGIPIFGICRGHQVINIALGGNLYQDIYSQVPDVLGHTSDYNIDDGYHSIVLEDDSIIMEIIKEKVIAVNSIHHQAIKDIGMNLKVTAYSKDNIVEVIESTNENFILGVQFHPEGMAKKHEKFMDIFKYFINACKNKG